MRIVSYAACLAGMQCKILSAEGLRFLLMLSTCEQQQVGHTNVQLDFVYMNRIRV